MQFSLVSTVMLAAVIGAGCSSTAPQRSAGTGGGGLIECTRIAPTGSRLRTHVECLPPGARPAASVKTWGDLEKQRAN